MFKQKIRFDRHEIAGSFGDIGTDLPLIVGMIQAVNLDSASIFISFGLMQILTGYVYGLPVPMQPLKAMAVLVITQKVSGAILFGGGLAIGAVMLVLTLTGISGYVLATLGFLIIITFSRHNRFPAGLILIVVGVLYAATSNIQLGAIGSGIGLTLPKLHQPSWNEIVTGFMVLALPQIPLSISNSVIATQQTVKDLFPERQISIRQIGLTYSIANLVVPFFSGVPVCHGCGGLAGHHALGARTGGSVILYGAMYLAIGLFFSRVFGLVIAVFPQPILGVILLFEALTLLLFIGDLFESKRDLFIALLVGLLAFLVPQGYLWGVIVGTVIYYQSGRMGLFKE